MGCSASKHQLGRDEKTAPLPRSLSVPGSRAKAECGSPSKSPWKSSNRGTGNMEGQYAGTQQAKSSSKLKPLKEEDLTVASVLPNQLTSQQGFECMDNLPRRKYVSRKYTSSDRSASFSHVQEDKSQTLAFLSDKGIGNGNGGHKPKLVENGSMRVDSRPSSFRVSESIDGLRLLLSPAVTPSRSFASSARSGTLSKTLSSSGRVASIESPKLLNTQVTQIDKVLSSQMEGMGDSEEVGSPLFDPSILATFEKAVEASSDEHWQGSDATSSSCSRVGCSSSDICSDAESLDCYREVGFHKRTEQSSAKRMPIEDRSCKVGSEDFHYRPNGVLKKKPSSKVSPLLNDAWVKKDYLEGFDVKCPPGCEDKIVLYVTSLRGIRKTYEDCCTVRLILKGFGVQVDERDVWMHSSFRKELTNVVGAVLMVPRLFVKGRYIGGADDVKHLHEEGILGNLLEGLPAESNSTCDICGGIRFIPCTSCSGSCKVISLREVSRCPDCNENGLMMCPICHW